MRQTVLLYQFLYVAANAADNTLFQSGNIALRNTQNICYLFLRVFLIAGKPETHTDNLFFTRRQQSDGIVDQEALDTALDFLIDGIRFSPQNIRKKQLVAIPIRIEWLIQRNLVFHTGTSPQKHEDFIFDTAAGISGQFDVFFGVKGIDGFNKADAADGDEILQINTGIIEFAGNIDDQADISLDEGLPDIRAAFRKVADEVCLLFFTERRWESFTASHIVQAAGEESDT